MRITVLPKTLLGRWSVGLVIGSLLFFGLGEAIVGPGPDFNMALANILDGVDAGIALGAFVTGLIGIIKRKERSILVSVAMAIGLAFFIGGATSLLGLQK